MRQAALELANAVSKPHTVLTSAPTNHEIQGYMSGRLDFETEVENDAEEAVKDLEFGLVMGYGGADQPEPGPPPASEPTPGEKKDTEGGDAESNDTTLEGTLPDPIETIDSAALKLALLDMYYEKLDRRQEAKTFVFDRGMLDFKKVKLIMSYFFPQHKIMTTSVVTVANSREKATQRRPRADQQTQALR